MDSTTTAPRFCPVCGRPMGAGEVCTHGMPPQPPPLQPLQHEPPPLKPRRSILEIILDPRSIQWLLASGGVLLVIGMVIWLASWGIFENPRVIAGAIGVGTLVLLAAGWWMILHTRFRMAGQAVTLLACLVMPLNLWFYHANQLLTLEGNLWMAGVVCCALYAASALVLRDPLFVYVLCAGVAGTGLLILADMHKFAEIAAPSLMLVIMGLAAIHAERAFAPDDGPFSRKRFGQAFFFSGHALLAAGLMLLLGAQVTGFLLAPLFRSWEMTVPAIVTDPTLRLLAIALVLAGTYAYIYSDLIVRKVGAYIYPAAFTLLWAELLALKQLNLQYGPEVILVTISFTALVLNVLQAILRDQLKVARAILPLAMLLSMMPVGYGVLLHIRATHSAVHYVWPYDIGWGYVGAMVITAVACRIGAYIHRKDSAVLAGAYFFLTAAASLVGAAGLLHVLHITAWSTQAPILMLIPIAYLIASRLYTEPIERNALLAVAQAATLVMLISVLASATHIAPRMFHAVQGQPQNLMLAIFFAEGAIFYSVLAGIKKESFHIFLATAMAGGAIWQVLNYFDTSAETYMLTFAALGLNLLIISRFAQNIPARSATAAGHALMTLSFLSAALMVFSRLLISRTEWSNAGLLGVMMLMTISAAVVSGSTGWRRAYVMMTIVNGILSFALLGALSDLSGWQKAEIFSVLAGIGLLIAGHVSWYREQNRSNEMAGFNLLLGSLLTGIPLLIAAIVNRFGRGISTPDEIALVTVSVLMLITGVMFQLRATTITGGALLALHLAMILGFAGWKAQFALGVYLSVGGAIVFLIGLGLAICRERLLELPEKIQKREGVFKVLAWR